MRTALAASLLVLLCLHACAQSISNDLVTVLAVGDGPYSGLEGRSGDEVGAAVQFGSSSTFTAHTARASGNALRFTGLACPPTPTLGAGSFIEVRVLPGSPYPEVRFSLDLRSFDQAAWEQYAYEPAPFHFLVCSLPGAEVFHQRGWMIGTPVIDEYIQMQAEGFGRQVVSSWSREWTYAPPIGAYPTPIAGLWNAQNRRYVGYDFSHARLTDNSEKRFGTAYCRSFMDSEQFVCLTWPFAKGYINLRYPEELPATIGTHFRILWSQDMGPDDDPNEFVHRLMWQDYADLLPGVEAMNDLSWLPDSYRPPSIDPPGNLGPFVHNTGDDGEHWWAPNVNIAGGVSYFSPVDYYYDTGSEENIRRLGEQCRELVKLGMWVQVWEDLCFGWQTPLDGGGADFFGPGVETMRHVNNWASGNALLDYVRNDPEGAADMVPYVDGVLRWTKQILYTRNCYPDVPAAQFAWSATPAVTFCLKYYFHFRDVPGHEELAALALKLARSMTYRYLAIWPSDNDQMDALDSSFFMEPNAGLNWLGCACANEIWAYNIAMLYEYVTFGDPIMGHYLRGMLERYHEMFQDQWFESVQAYGGEFTERFGLFDECAQGKGVRGSFGGLWGSFERLIWPLGTARARVVCGEKAAMCFNRDGRHTDISDYRYFGDGNFSFELVPGGLDADPERVFDVTVTFPFLRIDGKQVRATRDETVTLGEDRIVRYPADPSTLTLRGLRLGDVVSVGETQLDVEPLPCEIVKKREMPGPDDESVIERNGFGVLNLARGAFEGIERDWYDVKSMAGYDPGWKTIYGVPFLLLDPELTGNNVCVPRQGIAFGKSPRRLFLLVGDIEERSRITLYRDERQREQVDLSGAIPAVKGWPPVMQWHLDLVMVPNDGKPIVSITPTGCKIFAVTWTDKTDAALGETVAAIAKEQEKVAEHQRLVKAMSELAPLFKSFGGHIGILPIPKQPNVRSHPVVKMLTDAGLGGHLVFLTPKDLINTKVFNSRRIWIALYLSGEVFYQTVNKEGDAQEALIRWMQSGGTLVSLASGPFPFYYNELEKPVVAAPKFGLPISGSGAHERLDTLEIAPYTGWETVPDGLQLTFHTNPDQKVFTSLPATIPWPDQGDPRWRPTFNVVGKSDVYTPLVTLRDQEGKSYGEAAAMIDYREGELAGARVVYLWSTFRQATGLEHVMIADLFRYLLTNTLPPVGEYTCPRAGAAPVIDGKLDDEIWRQAPSTGSFTRFDPDRADGKDLRTEAKLAWDDENLYVAWRCEDPDVWSEIRERDGDLWEGEVVEIYVDADGDGEEYREIEISPLNSVVDLNIPKAIGGAPQDVEGARKWNAQGMVSAVSVDGTLDNRGDGDASWTVEAAIPLANFVDAGDMPRIGDQWRVQLLRIDRSKSLPAPQFSAWSVTDTFHNPGRFGRLIFGGNPCREDFDGYPEGAAPKPTWVPLAGEWEVVKGELIGRDSGTGGFLPTGIVTGDNAWIDYRVTVRFQVRQYGGDHRDGVWIGFRYSDVGNCYSLNLSRKAAILNKAAGGKTSNDLSSLAQAEWTGDNAWHTATITVQGNRIAVDMDGNRLLEAEDQGYLGVSPVASGGICLSARRWENATGNTVVAFDSVSVDLLD